MTDSPALGGLVPPDDLSPALHRDQVVVDFFAFWDFMPGYAGGVEAYYDRDGIVRFKIPLEVHPGSYTISFRDRPDLPTFGLTCVSQGTYLTINLKGKFDAGTKTDAEE